MGLQGRQAGKAGREAWPSAGAASALAPVTLSHGPVIWKDKPRSRVVVSV